VALRGVASACIDISDGVQTDIRRLAQASACGAALDVDKLPLSRALRSAAGADAWRYGLGGGEDYELAIAVAPSKLAGLQQLASSSDTPLTVVGSLCVAPGLTCTQQGREIPLLPAGFDHFGH
jgi:thiamine-monophosphate kinase